jgi:hypothetical protein
MSTIENRPENCWSLDEFWEIKAVYSVYEGREFKPLNIFYFIICLDPGFRAYEDMDYYIKRIFICGRQLLLFDLPGVLFEEVSSELVCELFYLEKKCQIYLKMMYRWTATEEKILRLYYLGGVDSVRLGFYNTRIVTNTEFRTIH